jgi:CDP-diacylglycerol---glycerol-3-phosphate 3-phosphatidyltransferase
MVILINVLQNNYMSDWKSNGQQLVYKLINPFINLLIKLGITPNFITVLGLVFNVLAAIVFVFGAENSSRDTHHYIGWACTLILVGGLMDMIDGRLARVGNQESKYGAMFDSVLDRYSEMIMFLGICYYLIGQNYFLSSLFAFLGLIGSVMVSYTRARAEGLGIKMSDVGLMQRPERILLVGVSGVICALVSAYFSNNIKFEVSWLPFPIFENITIFTFPLFVLAILANYTAVDRLLTAKSLFDKQSNL